jgi:Enterobacter phage Enc34, ssDNA-binding protein
MSTKYDQAYWAAGELMTPKVRMAYPNLLTARIPMNASTGKPKYSVTLLIPGTANIEVLRKAVDDTRIAKLGKNVNLKHPVFLETKNSQPLAEYAGQFPVFIRVSATVEYPPFIFGPDAKPFNGADSEIYGGRWAVAGLRPYSYDTSGNKGVSFGLQRIQLLDHDEPISGGRVATAEGFMPIDLKPGATADEMWN